MENGENCTFCTYGDQHGDCHRARHDVADVSHDPIVTNTKPPHFVKVVFATGGVAVTIPYKSEVVKVVKALLPITPLFSLTRIHQL